MPVSLKQPNAQKDFGSFYVQGKYMNMPIRRMFLSFGGFVAAASPATADYIIWTGGADVNPAMYNQRSIPGTVYDTNLDNEDVDVYLKSFEANKVVTRIGICRGAQLLCVLNNGSLWQDCDGHTPNHDSHDVYDTETGRKWIVNTDHHQQLILPKTGAKLLAYAGVSNYKKNAICEWNVLNDVGDGEVDVEAAWFPTTRCFCFQPHPEYPHEETRAYFWDLFTRFAVPPGEAA